MKFKSSIWITLIICLSFFLASCEGVQPEPRPDEPIVDVGNGSEDDDKGESEEPEKNPDIPEGFEEDADDTKQDPKLTLDYSMPEGKGNNRKIQEQDPVQAS